MSKRVVTVKAHKRRKGRIHVKGYCRKPPYNAVVKPGSKRAKAMPF